MPVTRGRLKRIRESVTPDEKKNIHRTALALKQWAAEGFPGTGKRGRPRLHFGMREEAYRLLMNSCSLDAPDLTHGLNWGLAFDRIRLESWRACIKEAFSPGYFWVGVEDGRAHIYDTFQSPFALADVPAAVEALRPKVTFHWAASLHPPTYSMPWPLPKARTPEGETKTFFALDEENGRLYCGASAAPAQRCGNISSSAGAEVKLMGVSGLPKDIARMKLRQWGLRHVGWFTANESSFERVAKMCGDHARGMLQVGE